MSEKILSRLRHPATTAKASLRVTLQRRLQSLPRADPHEVAEALGASGAKLFGGQVVGSLRFESRDREHEFLVEAGGSFYFPLMEKRLMNTGAANALQCAEDLALKSFVAARCARRQLEVDVGASSLIAELEEMVSALQKEKKDVEASLASVRIRAETSIKQLSEARERATAAEDAAKTAEEGRKSAEELVKAFRQVVSSEVVPLQSEVHSLLERFGIDAPVLAGEDANSVELIELFRWL